MGLVRHFTAWLRRRRLDDELREEMAQHLAWKTQALIDQGLPEPEARRRTAVETGNVTRFREQCPVPGGGPWYGSIALRARAGTDASSLAPALRAAVAAVDPAQPIAEVMTVRQEIDDSLASRRFETALFGGFAALAFTLSVFGLYAVTAYLVAQRSHEFGVRIALGARRATVFRRVLRQGLAPAAAGIVLGLLAALLLTRLLRTMLFAVETFDATVFAAVALVLALVSIAAAIVPARRAVRVDPVVALRCD